jgi:endonuclease/exonuclease/phosphatase family metal-dependent hydrolase
MLYSSELELWDHNGNEPHPITHYRIPRLARVKQTRVCGWCRFRTQSGESFDIYNTHLSLPSFFARVKGPTGGRFGEAENQVQEVNNVMEFIQQRGNAERSILVGDFNSRPGSKVYNRVLRLPGFQDAHAQHLGLDAHQMARIHSAGFLAMRFRLDHVFSGAGIQFADFKNTHPYGPEHPWGTLSDHSPIVGKFLVG